MGRDHRGVRCVSSRGSAWGHASSGKDTGPAIGDGHTDALCRYAAGRCAGPWRAARHAAADSRFLRRQHIGRRDSTQELIEIKGNKNLLTKCKFVCINGCGEEIEFDNINKHYKSKCLKKNKKNIKNIKNKKLEILTKEEVAKIKKQKKKEMKYLTSKL